MVTVEGWPRTLAGRSSPAQPVEIGLIKGDIWACRCQPGQPLEGLTPKITGHVVVVDEAGGIWDGGTIQFPHSL